MTTTPATAERLARALDILERHVVSMYRAACPQANRPPDDNAFAREDEAVIEARAALAAYEAEGGKL